MQGMNFVSPHPSGVGFFILPPKNIYYQVWRNPGPSRYEYEKDEDGELLLDPYTGQAISEAVEYQIPILSGYEKKPRCLLDWSAPCTGEVEYWLEVSENENGPWTEVRRVKVEAQADMYYSVFEDGITMDTPNIRDVVKVFFSVRLAQLASEGHVVARKPEWKKRFPMTVSYDFGEADLPTGSVSHAHSRGGPADLGWNITEEDIKLSIIFATETREERDSITQAVRGLMQELDWLLEDLGCQNTSYGEMAEGYQDVAPVLYTLELAVGTTSFTWHSPRDYEPWEFLSIDWSSADGETAEIYPVEPEEEVMP